MGEAMTLEGKRFTAADLYVRSPAIFNNPWNADGTRIATWWQCPVWEMVWRQRRVDAELAARD